MYVPSAEFMPISFTSILAKTGYHLHFSCGWLILKFCFHQISTSSKNLFYIFSIRLLELWVCCIFTAENYCVCELELENCYVSLSFFHISVLTHSKKLTRIMAMLPSLWTGRGTCMSLWALIYMNWSGKLQSLWASRGPFGVLTVGQMTFG